MRLLLILSLLMISFNFICTNLSRPSEGSTFDFDIIDNLTNSMSRSLRSLNLSIQEIKLDKHVSSVLTFLRLRSNESSKLHPSPVKADFINNDYAYGFMVNATDDLNHEGRINATGNPRKRDRSRLNSLRTIRDVEMSIRLSDTLRNVMLTDSESPYFIQAHCFDEVCSSICFHLASNGEGCARHILRPVPPGFSGYDLADVNPNYFLRCCGNREFFGRDCFVYTPQVDGPSISCFRSMLNDGKFSSQLPAL